jgi:geranylgeranyl pyrophosphate synthase
MAYSLFAGGKRLRPVLLLWCYDAVCKDRRRRARVTRRGAVKAAAALEMLHTYSLIHDDLPAMDDDVLRRGRATCHVAFDEATAILAGDGLQALAFAVLGGLGGSAAHVVAEIATAVGPAGMVGGQHEDLAAERKPVTANDVRQIHRKKTALVIAAALTAGAELAGAGVAARAKIHAAGVDLGLAFQGADDLLDVTGSAEQLGKSAGKDAAVGKATWVRVEGIDRARRRTVRYGKRGQRRLGAALPDSEAAARLLALTAKLWQRDR